MKKAVCVLLTLILAGCIPQADPGGPVGTVPVDAPNEDTTVTAGTGSFPWDRYFVTDFAVPDVQRIRSLPGYLANDLKFTLRIDDHPVYQGLGKAVLSHPMAAARLDYALSTGLMGAGQIVSLIDDGIRLSHEQFAGKTIHTSGAPPAAGNFHGTAVASVMAGNGAGGGTIGFAPGAALHQGHLDYGAPVSWSALGRYMNDAAAIGAVVSNNSWGLADRTVGNTDLSAFSNGTRPYIDGLRAFVQRGTVVFALQNDYDAGSASLLAALPTVVPELEPNWISVVNAIPEFDDDRIIRATRISTACLETARFCMAANGQIKVATEASDSSYRIGVGASFAAPQVAGSIALLAEAFPDLSAAQLRDRLLATADNGFFEHDAVLEFAPGISHGYNAEFGHGFLDLRSALLPIGKASVPMANGPPVHVGEPAIMSGAASGDALLRSLSAVDIIVTDRMHGHFVVAADVLVGMGSRDDSSAEALMAAFRRDGPPDKETAWLDPSGIDVLGGVMVPLNTTSHGLGLAVVSGESTTGLSVGHVTGNRSGELALRLTAMRTAGSMLGIRVPGTTGEITSVTTALQVVSVTSLSAETTMRLTAELGIADGDGAGMVRDFTAVVYDRIGLAVLRNDIRTNGDSLAVFTRRPIAITRGAARIDLPVPQAAGGVGFAVQDLNLAPADRQFDIGFDYSRPLPSDGTFSVGLLHSWNDGNIADRTSLSAFVGVQLQL